MNTMERTMKNVMTAAKIGVAVGTAATAVTYAVLETPVKVYEFGSKTITGVTNAIKNFGKKSKKANDYDTVKMIQGDGFLMIEG